MQTKEEKATYMRAWYARNPDKARTYWKRKHSKIRSRLDAIKLAAGCIDCGYKENPVALDFDHVRGVKKFKIGYGAFKKPWGEVEAEIAKCEVRCANCHRIKTYKV